MDKSWHNFGWGGVLTFIFLLTACQPEVDILSPTATSLHVETNTDVPSTNTPNPPTPTESQPIPTASATKMLIPSSTPILAEPIQSNDDFEREEWDYEQSTPLRAEHNQSNGRSNSPVISSDGQVIAFLSTGNLTGNATLQMEAVFVRDRSVPTTELINVTLHGQAGAWPVYGMTLSGNGRVVAYYSHDGNLVPDDEMDCGTETQPFSCEDLFIFDRGTGLTERLPLGRGDGLGKDITLALSADGRFVAYSFHVYDRLTGQITDIPTTNGGPPDGYTFAPQFAGDDRFLAFVSSAANFIPNDNNEQFDVFVWDRETNQVELVSTADGEQGGNETSGAIPFSEGIGDALTISGDGRFIAYASLATNLADGVVNDCDDFLVISRTCYNIYMYDRQTGETRLVTNNSNGDSYAPSLSGDGRFLAFASGATTLTDDMFPECSYQAIVSCGQIYLYDQETGQINLISRGTDGQLGNQGSWRPVIAENGRYIAFVSIADNLVAGDTNENSDIFLFDREMQTIEMLQTR